MSKRQPERTYIYKSKTISKRLYYYKKPDTLQRQDVFRYIFIYWKQNTLHYTIFHEKFEVGII